MSDALPWKFFADELELCYGAERGGLDGLDTSRGRAISEASRATLDWLMVEQRWPSTAARILVARFVDRAILWSLIEEHVSSLAMDLQAIWAQECGASRAWTIEPGKARGSSSTPPVQAVP